GNEENASTRLADLDPSTIESIEVLKGASAAAIYGTRANAGVVIITTKRGSAGKTQVSFSQDIGTNTIIRRLGLRDWTADSVASVYDDAEADLFRQAVANNAYYDYEDELYGETGLILDSRLSLTGGSDKTRFFIGASRRNENGIILNTGFDRNSFRVNLDHDLTDRITIGTSTNYVNSVTNRGFTGNENEGGLSYGYNLAFTRPWAELHPDEQGNYPDNPNFAGNMLLVRDLAQNEERVNRIIQGLNIGYNILQTDNSNIRLNLNGGIDYYLNETSVYVPEFHQAQRGLQNGYVGRGRNKVFNGNLQGFLVYNQFLMGGDLSLSTQLGATYLSQQVELLFAQATQLVPGQVNLNSAATQQLTENRSFVQEQGLVAQEEVNFKDQIIGTVGVRLDKSTLNSDPNQYFAFPKASLAVNIANFDFWSVPAINALKPRIAWGQTGSSAAFGSLFTLMNQTNIDGGVGLTVAGALGATTLVPETSTELEAGLDLSLLDNKIALEATFYQRDIFNLILTRGLPASSGFTQESGNFADLRNQGIELSLVTKNVSKESFDWTTTVNWWRNLSTVTRLDVPAFPQPGAGFGLGLGSFYVEEGASITQFAGNLPDPNDPDVNIPTNIGDAMPDFQMSVFSEMTLAKNFDFNFLAHWKQGGDVLNLTKFLTDLAGTTPDLDTPEGQERIAQGTIASRFLEDASYFRLREVSLYYTLPKVSERIEQIKVGVSGRNLFTLTNYSGYDPEVSVNGSSSISSGIDVTPFPTSKQAYFHFNIRF
ncbi:MAG TPA: SusC/RagA family TonB-linked outer membrane protein, partial [Cytophagales bacterium]|nr:SusC/RagA family TonB-linked outer membrane protein [Cytophagales bacterium]